MGVSDMKDGGLDWLGAVPVLLAAARTGSATAAAKALGASTPTVIRRLTALEEALGARLFERTPTGLLPTAALELVIPWAEQVEAAALGLEREVQGLETQPIGVVRVALLPSLACRFVTPQLPRLMAQYPNLVLDLLPQSAIVDLVRREADLAIRLVRPDNPDLIVKELGSFRLSVAVAPKLLAAVAPKSLADLPWLDWSPALSSQPEFRWLAAAVPEANVVLRSLDLETLLRAAQEGVGALVVAEPLAAASGGLVHAPVPTPEMPEGKLWLAAHRAVRPVPRVAAVWTWLREQFSQQHNPSRVDMPRV